MHAISHVIKSCSTIHAFLVLALLFLLSKGTSTGKYNAWTAKLNLQIFKLTFSWFFYQENLSVWISIQTSLYYRYRELYQYLCIIYVQCVWWWVCANSLQSNRDTRQIYVVNVQQRKKMMMRITIIFHYEANQVGGNYY